VLVLALVLMLVLMLVLVLGLTLVLMLMLVLVLRLTLVLVLVFACVGVRAHLRVSAIASAHVELRACARTRVRMCVRVCACVCFAMRECPRVMRMFVCAYACVPLHRHRLTLNRLKEVTNNKHDTMRHAYLDLELTNAPDASQWLHTLPSPACRSIVDPLLYKTMI